MAHSGSVKSDPLLFDNLYLFFVLGVKHAFVSHLVNIPGNEVQQRLMRPLHRPGINLIRLEEELSEVHLRLSPVTIENLPYQKFLEKYDRPGVFFYLDPPYWKAPWYRFNMELPDYKEMAGRLATIKAQFILSINDTPEIRDIFKRFKIKPVSTTYTLNRGRRQEGKELLISNFRKRKEGFYGWVMTA